MKTCKRIKRKQAPPKLNSYGKMNRRNRIYFSIKLLNQAAYLGINSATLSSYEFSHEAIPAGIKTDTHRFWSEKFDGKR